MMSLIKLPKEQFPPQLLEIPQQPKELYVWGTLPDPSLTLLAIVGSRRHTSYGRDVCKSLIEGLAGYPVGIVSGLALGIDTIAHETALAVGLPTFAFPGSGLNPSVLYPRTNLHLAEKIVTSGGGLISEFAPDFKATIWSFPQRNRLMAGMVRAVLIIEAEEKSGTLITARLATEYNRDVFVVPGSIFSESSKGTHMLLRLGATPIMSSKDILEALGFTVTTEEIRKEANALYESASPEEKNVLELLREPKEKDELFALLDTPITQANALLSLMEIKGMIKEEYGEIRKNV